MQQSIAMKDKEQLERILRGEGHFTPRHTSLLHKVREEAYDVLRVRLLCNVVKSVDTAGLPLPYYNVGNRTMMIPPIVKRTIAYE